MSSLTGLQIFSHSAIAWPSREKERDCLSYEINNGWHWQRAWQTCATVASPSECDCSSHYSAGNMNDELVKAHGIWIRWCWVRKRKRDRHHHIVYAVDTSVYTIRINFETIMFTHLILISCFELPVLQTSLLARKFWLCHFLPPCVCLNTELHDVITNAASSASSWDLFSVLSIW